MQRRLRLCSSVCVDSEFASMESWLTTCARGPSSPDSSGVEKSANVAQRPWSVRPVPPERRLVSLALVADYTRDSFLFGLFR